MLVRVFDVLVCWYGSEVIVKSIVSMFEAANVAIVFVAREEMAASKKPTNRIERFSQTRSRVTWMYVLYTWPGLV